MLICSAWQFESCKLLDVYGIDIRRGAREEVLADDGVGSVSGMERVPEQMALPVLAERHSREAWS